MSHDPHATTGAAPKDGPCKPDRRGGDVGNPTIRRTSDNLGATRGAVVIARIVVQGVTADVYSPYEARDIMRSLPDRRWSKAHKKWIIPVVYVDMCADMLRAYGITVYVTAHNGQPWSGNGHHGQRDQPAATWIEEAFAAVPLENVPVLRRSLLTALHPDRGGDPELAKAINHTADRRLNGTRHQ